LGGKVDTVCTVATQRCPDLDLDANVARFFRAVDFVAFFDVVLLLVAGITVPFQKFLYRCDA